MARKVKLTIPIDVLVKTHLEFEVVGERDGTFTVLDHTVGPMQVRYTGFPAREDAERFVLAQPEPWE